MSLSPSLSSGISQHYIEESRVQSLVSSELCHVCLLGGEKKVDGLQSAAKGVELFGAEKKVCKMIGLLRSGLHSLGRENPDPKLWAGERRAEPQQRDV